MNAQLLPDWLARRADLAPDSPALLARGLRWTFADLDRAATRAALQLAARGAHPGDRVALLLRNGFDFAALTHGAPRGGVTLVPLNSRLTAAELAFQLEDCDARLLICDDSTTPLADQVAGILPEMSIAHRPSEGDPGRSGDLNLQSPISNRQHHIDLSATHTIVYTSGTTGRPKGAMLSYGNHWWSAVGSALNLGALPTDRWLAPLPLFHVGGLAILMRGAIYGIPVVLPESTEPAAINRAIDEHGVSIVSVVSALLRRMLDDRGERPYPPSLRCVLLGGGPAPRALLEECVARGVPVVQTYGLTEAASQVATLAPGEALRKLGSAGKPLLPNELRIAGGGAPGSVGEILVRGPSVMIGYVNSIEASAAALREGWLHTGDLGYLDDEGYLYVVDRRDDLIISGGENVYPAEVEAALVAHPSVAEAGVVGAPDEGWGQVPVAFLVLRGGAPLDEDALRSFLSGQLARYKLPRAFHAVAALPRNAAGKLRRDELRRWIADAPEASHTHHTS